MAEENGSGDINNRHESQSSDKKRVSLLSKAMASVNAKNGEGRMDIETARDYCLSLPQVTEDFPFDETTLVFRIGGKIFAMMDLENTEWFVLKCEPEYAIELRERHLEIAPAWHMNKKHWNQLNLFGSLPDGLVRSLICHSYNEVVKKMPKRVKSEAGIQLLPAV